MFNQSNVKSVCSTPLRASYENVPFQYREGSSCRLRPSIGRCPIWFFGVGSQCMHECMLCYLNPSSASCSTAGRLAGRRRLGGGIEFDRSEPGLPMMNFLSSLSRDGHRLDLDNHLSLASKNCSVIEQAFRAWLTMEISLSSR